MMTVAALTLSAAAAWFFLGGIEDSPQARERLRFQKRLDTLHTGASAGDQKIQLALADLYRRAKPEMRDLKQAAEWYRRAADGGSAPARFALGEMYAKGEGVRQDYAAAAKWFRLAAGAGGNAEAQFALGELYFNGRGVGNDIGLAIDWYRKAAANGHPVAQYLLGRMYDDGWGVDRNAVEAYVWYSRALAGGARGQAYDSKLEPVADRARLAAKMNRSQIEEAKRMLK